MVDNLLKKIRSCKICEKDLPCGVNPILDFSADCKVLLIGQAPSRKVHENSVPWNDKSGETLRSWLGVESDVFYDVSKVGLVPMGFCYPGKGKSGDLPPRKECAPKWHPLIFEHLKQVELIVLIGSYAQKYYLGALMKKTLTETVRSFASYEKFFPIVHPSPRNGIWLRKNLWFERDVVPELQRRVKSVLSK